MAINENGILVERQYIGARYVVKIYENSQNAGSAEWEANTVYEPLTLVTYQYGSYLSKKIVPATVGNPAENNQYWVQTGFYNGQISSLQEQVNAITADIGNMDNLTESTLVEAINNLKESIVEDETEWTISTMLKKTVIMIGDSWGATNAISSNTWTELLEPYFKKAYISAQGGYSFNTYGASFITLLNNITVDPGDTIDAIIAIGGANGVSENDVTAFINACKNLYPSAEIIIGCNGPAINNSAYYARERIIEKECIASHVKCLYKLWQTFMKSGLSNWHSDYYHMLDYTDFVTSIVSYLVIGKYNDAFPALSIYSSTPTSKGSTLSPYFLDLGNRGCTRCGDDYMFYVTFIKGDNFDAASDSIELTSGTFYDLCVINAPNIIGFYSNNRPDTEVNNKGFLVHIDTNYNLFILQDGVSPYPKMVLYAKTSGTFTKAQLFPNSSLQFMLKGTSFNFASPNELVQSCIVFSQDNI